jgi:hypothetical protein
MVEVNLVTAAIILASGVAFGFIFGYGIAYHASQRALTFVQNEVLFLRKAIVDREDTDSRIARASAGLPERPAPVKEREEIPEGVRDLCEMFPLPIAQDLKKQARDQHSRGVSWRKIEEEIREQIRHQDPNLMAEA